MNSNSNFDKYLGEIVTEYDYIIKMKLVKIEENSNKYVFYLFDENNKQISIPINMKMYDEKNKMLKKIKGLQCFIIEKNIKYVLEYNGEPVLLIQ